MFKWKMVGWDKNSNIFTIPFTPYYMSKLTKQNLLVNNYGGRQKSKSVCASKRREISITIYYSDTWKEQQDFSIIEGFSAVFSLLYRFSAI